MILNCVPKFDSVTEYSSRWNGEIMDYIREKGVSIESLLKDDAVRSKVEAALQEHPGEAFVFYDHGDKDCLVGNDRTPVIDLRNVGLLRDRIVYTLACLSAKILGYEAHRRGCKTYWGYTEVFAFTSDALDEFKESANIGLKLWADDGFKSHWNVYLEGAKQRFTELVDQLLEEGKPFAAMIMRRNRDVLVCYNGAEPEKPCVFRRMAVKLFGKRAWFIPRRMFASIALFFGGWLGALHALAHMFWEKGGIPEILAPQGDYLLYACMMIGYLLLP
nr:hypothetical protein [Nitrososphaeria archaeon]